MISRDKGFTLVEILLALAILGIGLVGILSVFAVGTNSVRRTITLTEAGFIGQMVMEDFKRQSYSDPSSIGVPDDYKNYYEDYDVSIEQLESVGNPPNLYRVDISIKKKNTEKSLVEFSTYLAKYEP